MHRRRVLAACVALFLASHAAAAEPAAKFYGVILKAQSSYNAWDGASQMYIGMHRSSMETAHERACAWLGPKGSGTLPQPAFSVCMSGAKSESRTYEVGSIEITQEKLSCENGGYFGTASAYGSDGSAAEAMVCGAKTRAEARQLVMNLCEQKAQQNGITNPCRLVVAGLADGTFAGLTKFNGVIPRMYCWGSEREYDTPDMAPDVDAQCDQFAREYRQSADYAAEADPPAAAPSPPAPPARNQPAAPAQRAPGKASGPQRQVVLDGQEFAATPAETRDFENAIGAIRSENYKKAVTALAELLRKHPDSGYAGPALYWLGQAQFQTGNHKLSAASAYGFATGHADHPKAPDALLLLAESCIGQNNITGARRALAWLAKDYPASEAAGFARDLLKTLQYDNEPPVPACF